MLIRFLVIMLLVISFSAKATQKAQIDYDQMYSNCLTDSGPVNNGTVSGCSELTSEAAKTEMNILYKRIYDTFASDFPDDATKLEQTQRAWITYRNGQCNLAGAHVGSPMYSYCPMQLNIARVNELREMAGE